MPRPRKVLFVHTPKAAGVHLIRYFVGELDYPNLQSEDSFADGGWRDFDLDGLAAHLEAEAGFLHTHSLSFGWSELVELIPPAEKDDIVEKIRQFRANGWFTFTFVRHPGELLCSFYFYVLDTHARGWHNAVTRHAPVLELSLDEFVSRYCDSDLIPDYWRELDFVDEASDAAIGRFFQQHFAHDYKPGRAPSHASGSRGYEHYCEAGFLSPETVARVERSRNLALFREIVSAREELR